MMCSFYLALNGEVKADDGYIIVKMKVKTHLEMEALKRPVY